MPNSTSLLAIAVAGLMASGRVATAQTRGDVEKGKAAYGESCRSCHGANGEGNQAMARRQKVTIRDLKSPDVQKQTDDVWRDQIVRGVGKMNPTEDVTPADVTNIIAFMRSLAPNANSAASSAPAAPRPAAPEGDAVAGRAVYARECRSCHGASGEGNPAMAKRLGVAIRPLGGAEVQKQTDEDWRKAIVDGIGKMYATPDISPADVANTIAFMRTLKPK